MNIFDLTGKRALITGSTRGIGLALAGGLARAGAGIVLNGRDAARLGATAAELASKGVTVTASRFDATDHAAVSAAIDAVESQTGPIDILINNAGMQHRAPLEDFPEAVWHKLMRTNLDSAFFVGQAVARHMIRRSRGAIINIGSVQSELGRPGIAPYAASKGGLKMLTKGMAIDWGKHGIRVNGLSPGYFKTELNAALTADAAFTDWLTRRTPLGRWGEVEELIGAAVFLASDASSFVTGHMLFVDGGVTSQL
jgi:gluconate 5-dehydrogenase